MQDDKIIINNIDNSFFKDHGINSLTGEADALGLRMLCEVTKETMVSYLEYTGIQGVDIDTLPLSSWNDRKRYAVFLTYETRVNLCVMRILSLPGVNLAMFLHSKRHGEWSTLPTRIIFGDRDAINEHLKSRPNIYGFYDASIGKYGEYVEGEYWNPGRRFDTGSNPRRSYSNIHAMSGMSQ